MDDHSPGNVGATNYVAEKKVTLMGQAEKILKRGREHQDNAPVLDLVTP